MGYAPPWLQSLKSWSLRHSGAVRHILGRHNVIALGNVGTGKTPITLTLSMAACPRGFSVTFTTAASLLNQLPEARDERRLCRLQGEMAAVKLLIVGELGYVPPSSTGAELMIESHRSDTSVARPWWPLGRELIQPIAVADVFFLRLEFLAQEDRDGTVVLALR